jgi:hypothetical protein
MTRRISNGVALQWLGLGLILTGVYWLITPDAHPDSSLVRTVAVYGQVLAGIIFAYYGIRLANQEQQIFGGRYRAMVVITCWVMAGALIVGTAGHWLITPASHLGASNLRVFLVWGQIVIGLGLMATGGAVPGRAPRSLA